MDDVAILYAPNPSDLRCEPQDQCTKETTAEIVTPYESAVLILQEGINLRQGRRESKSWGALRYSAPPPRKDHKALALCYENDPAFSTLVSYALRPY